MLEGLLRRFGNDYLEIEKLSVNESSEIYIVQNVSSEIYTLKLYKKEFSEKKFAKQIEIYTRLGQLESPYFLKYISNSKDEFIAREKYIVLELVEKGDLMDCLLSAKLFSPKLTKIIVWKLIHGINQMHSRGIVHRKISIEKIFLDKFYNLKIAGFDHSKIVKEGQINLFKYDIFDLGMMIIQLLTGKPNMKIIRDKIKLATQKGNFESFWNILEAQGLYDFTPELKDLVTQMLSGKIAGITKLLSHDWFATLRNITQNEFELYEQFMKNELRRYEVGENEENIV